MRIRVLVPAFAVLALLALSSPAVAADGWPWRATSPRVRLQDGGDRLELVIPRGRARGATSTATSLDPGSTYLVAAHLEPDATIPRGAFLRVALYASADGSGRQRLRLDSALVTERADGVTVLFDAPAWAHAARIRVLARPDRRTTLDATRPSLLRIERAGTVLRPNE